MMKASRYNMILPLRSTGFSLVELLVAMTIGLFLTAGMLVMFAGNKRSSSLTNEMANMQESIRFALNAVSDDVRMAGHQGCMDLNAGTVNIVAKDPPSTDLQSTYIAGSVIGSDGSWEPMPPMGTGTSEFSEPTSVTPRPGTHALFVQFAQTPGSSLSGSAMSGGIPSATGALMLSREISVETGDLALVSTCESGEIFRVSSVDRPLSGGMVLGHGASKNTRAAFQQTYGTSVNIAQTRVMPFSSRVYFVADSGIDKEDGSPIYGLYQQTMPFDEDDNPPVMLVEGVENMRIQFGVGAANGQLRYVSADNAAYNASQIRNARIGLLMASYDPLLETSDANTYQLAGTSVSRSTTDTSSAAFADDRRLRLAFNTTVNVRNRRSLN